MIKVAHIGTHCPVQLTRCAASCLEVLCWRRLQASAGPHRWPIAAHGNSSQSTANNKSQPPKAISGKPKLPVSYARTCKRCRTGNTSFTALAPPCTGRFLVGRAGEQLVLGIESSCDDTGVAVVRASDGAILGHAIANQASAVLWVTDSHDSGSFWNGGLGHAPYASPSAVPRWRLSQACIL